MRRHRVSIAMGVAALALASPTQSALASERWLSTLLRDKVHAAADELPQTLAEDLRLANAHAAGGELRLFYAASDRPTRLGAYRLLASVREQVCAEIRTSLLVSLGATVTVTVETPGGDSVGRTSVSRCP